MPSKKRQLVPKSVLQNAIDAATASVTKDLGLKGFAMSKRMFMQLVDRLMPIASTIPESMEDLMLRSKDLRPIPQNAHTFGSPKIKTITAVNKKSFPVKKGSIVDRILLVLRRSSEALTSRDVAMAAKISPHKAAQTLQLLRDKKQVHFTVVPRPGLRQPRYRYTAVAS